MSIGLADSYNVITMKTKLIAIGNSKGIRLPKAVIEQYGLKDDVELDMHKEGLMLRAARTARQGWDAAFAQMRRHGDDLPADQTENEFDRKEWRW